MSSQTSSIEIEWNLEEKIRLLELFSDKNLLWEDRAKKLQEEFQEKRPMDFFTILTIKSELNKIFSRPNPEHHIFGLPSHPRGKEAAEMWIKHFRKEQEESRERRKQMFAIALRNQLDLIRRHQQGKLSMEELDALLLEARERDAKRTDKTEHEARLNNHMKKLHTEDITNVRTFTDYFRYLSGERIPKPVKSPSPVKIVQEIPPKLDEIAIVKIDKPLKDSRKIPPIVAAKFTETQPGKQRVARETTRTQTTPTTESRITRKRKQREPDEADTDFLNKPAAKVQKRQTNLDHKLDKPGTSTRLSPSVSPITSTSLSSSVTSHDEGQLTGEKIKKRRTSIRRQTQEQKEMEQPEVVSLKRPTRRRTSTIGSMHETEEISKIQAIQEKESALEPMAPGRMEISDFSLEAFSSADEIREIFTKKPEGEGEETVVIETDGVEGLFPVETAHEMEAICETDLDKTHSIGTQTHLSIRHQIVPVAIKTEIEMLEEEAEEEIKSAQRAKSDSGNVPARATRSSKAPHSLGLQTDKVRFARDDTFYVERESDGGWPGGYFVRTITIDEQCVSSPLRSPQLSPRRHRFSSISYSPLKQPLGSKLQKSKIARSTSSYDADTCAQIELENEQIRKREEAERQSKEKSNAAQQTPKKNTRTRPSTINSKDSVAKISPQTTTGQSANDEDNFRIKVVVYPEGEENPELDELQKKPEELLTKTEPTAVSVPSGTSTQQPLLSEVAATTKLRSSLRRAAIATATPSPAVDSIGDYGLFLRPGNHSSTETIPKNILLRLWRDIHSHRYSPVFSAPVSEEAVPGYHSAIKKPMDLKTLKAMIESGTVHTFGQFTQAIIQMFANAVMYNSTGHYVNSNAKEMLAYALKCTEVVQFPGGLFQVPCSSHQSNGSSSDSGRISRGSVVTMPKFATQKPTISQIANFTRVEQTKTETAVIGDEEYGAQQQTRHLFQRRPPRNKKYSIWNPI